MLSLSSVSIITLTENKVPQVIQLQKIAFQGYLNSRIGQPYIRAFITWFQESEDGIALCAVNQSNQTIGYVVGAPDGYFASMNRKIIWPATFGILLRPWLFLDPHFRQVVRGRLRTIFPFLSRNQASSTQLHLPQPIFSLVGIGVHPDARGKQVGEKLMLAFENEAIARQAKSMRLSVYPDNTPARKLYTKVGWEPFEIPQKPNSNKAIYYFKVLN